MTKVAFARLFAGVSLVATAVSAQAQTGPAADAVTDGDAETIVVTGSRVIKNGDDSPTPVTVLTMESLQAAHPTSVFEALLSAPAFAGSRGGTQSAPSGNRATSSSINALNLRGLGPVRTLILYDGHRVPPTQIDGLVDANIIPQMLLERVDVVTGGASAVYGSDAIGGVVNFITNRKFKGVKFEAQRGISQRDDAGTYRLGIGAGADLFDGRGHIMGSVETFHNDGLIYPQRASLARHWTVQGNGTTVPYYLTPDVVSSGLSWGGKITAVTGGTSTPNLNTTFNTNGVLTPFVNGAAIASSSSVRLGGDGIWDTVPSLRPRTSQIQAYGRFDYELSDSLRFHLTGAYTYDHAFNNFGNVNSNGLVISATNPFLSQTIRDQFAAAGVKTFTMSKKYAQGLVPSSNVDFHTHDIYVNAGLDGKIGAFDWSTSYTFHNVRLDTYSNYTFDNGKFFAALDAVDEGVYKTGVANNNIVCKVSITNPGLYPGCVPINLFGPSSETQQMVDYVRRQGKFVTKLPSHDADFTISGEPFETWAGPVGMALNAEWHRQGLELTSTNPTVDYLPLDCTGLTLTTDTYGGNCKPGTVLNPGDRTPSYNGGVAPRPPVDMSVIEGAVEFNVPLIKDWSLAESVNLSLADRYAKYVAHGNPDITKGKLTNRFEANTWKVGLDWNVSRALSFRATRSRDFRAPNLYEMYQTLSTTFSNGNQDRLTGRSTLVNGALIAVESQGNPNLKPEVANTLTLGAVIRPSSKFSVAIDYFDIKIRDFIKTLTGSDAALQQACYNGTAPEYCLLQERPGSFTDTSGANTVTKWKATTRNIALMKTQGIDVEANFTSTLFGRPFALRALASYQPHVYLIQPGLVTQDYAGAIGVPADFVVGPKFRATFSAHAEPLAGLTVDWETRVRGVMHQSPDPTLSGLPSADALSATYHSMTLTWTPKQVLDGRVSVYLNVTDLFDHGADPSASFVNQTSPGLGGGFVLGDDPTGRYFRFGVRGKF
ncbi:TonB-dependent receptor [Novosphingobium flavum]|uniref:TonB-dependent receptor n=1 Tax=Novosphingobium flavum TaxID=1778672 RepID=A0A7X1FT34_9SPHN|nr:TonB-dependent receptor [Novosphingobium flavum]MBC2665857.1 TonB-dependent receptor [Novosphingobium flavum]